MTLISCMIDQLCFHNAEKRLGYGVIPAISLSGHALDKAMLTEFFSEIRAGILNATIRMKNKTISWSSTPDRPLQRRYDHLMTQRAAQSPADHHPRKQIDDHRQVQPPRVRRQVGYIRYPHLIRAVCGKVSLKQIRCHRKMVLTVGGHPVFVPDYRTKPHCSHSLRHTVLTHFPSPIFKLLGNLGAAVSSLFMIIDFSDLGIQFPIFDFPSARPPLQPSIIPATRHLKDSAHLRYTPIRAVLAYEPEYRCGSVEKMATAFFKMSRSRRSRSFSRFSRRSFSSSYFLLSYFALRCVY